MTTDCPALLRRIAGGCCLALLMAAGLPPRTAHAWSERGHRVSGLVAERLLTPQARTALKQLMGRVDLATASLYLDQHRDALEQRLPGSRQWHYDNRPACAPDAPKAGYCPDGRCASAQIARHYRRLADARTSAEDKRLAVYVIAHLVGDIHQPLHSADNRDRGGNDVLVAFTLPGGRRVTTNLHAAWDTDFVTAAFKQAEDRRVAQDLIGSVDADTMIGFQKGAADAWLRESFDLATTSAYGRLPGFHCAPLGDSGGAAVEADRSARRVLPASYVDSASAAVPMQLLKAGARLAYLLNRGFAGTGRDGSLPD